jgi:hypothetical protein
VAAQVGFALSPAKSYSSKGLGFCGEVNASRRAKYGAFVELPRESSFGLAQHPSGY